MDPLDFGRWQFGITTVYHFFMVPLTLGLGLVVTYLYICYVRTKKDEYKRMTKFWGKLYLINFAMGVATGLVQEFQFGMAFQQSAEEVMGVEQVIRRLQGNHQAEIFESPQPGWCADL